MRYFGKSVDEWDSLPWWQAEMYLEGLQDQKIIGGGGSEEAKGQKPGASESPKPTLDLTSAALDTVGGFTTRRAG